MKSNKLLTLSIILLISLNSFNPAGKKIFNGKNLKGWEVQPEDLISNWKVKKKGILHGENPEEKGSIIWTDKEFKDYEMGMEFRTLTEDYDTGVFPRGEGTQVQIGISRSLQKDMTACIYAPADEKGAYPAQTDKVKEFHKPGEWNHLRIIVEGKNIKTFLNGEPFIDYKSVSMNEKGPIGLQLHGGVHMEVEFRDIYLKKL